MPRIDLNLLRVFETLYEMRSVTRAAERLGLTQSAVSHALGRLRDTIGDPLFVRHSRGLQPTALANEIAPGVREGLEQLRGALSPAPFEPATAARRFRISTGVYFSALLVPDLIARIRTIAPNVSIAVVAPERELLASLDNGTTDIALGGFGKAPPRIKRQLLYREELVWVARAGNPVLQDPGLLATMPADQFLNVAVGRPFPGHGAYSWENGLERLVVTSVPSELPNRPTNWEGPNSVRDALTALATVASTDLIARVPRRLAEHSVLAQGTAIVEADMPADHFEMAMLWHERLASDSGLHWLRELIADCLRNSPDHLSRGGV